MALQGTLDTFALPDVLRLLATTAKTGRLHVEGDRGQGSVWLRDGTVMAAGADRAPEDATAEEVVFELLRFENGSFAFQMDELSPNGEQPEDVEILLRNAGALLKEWNELKTVVPSLDHRVTLVDSLAADHVTIDADRWPLLVTIARSSRTICDLARAMGLSELSVVRIVRDLVDLGVVAIEAPRETRPSVERSRAERGSRDRSRSSPFGSLGSGETLATAPPSNGGYSTGEMQRDGWLQSPERTSGSHTAIAPEARSQALPPPDEDIRTPPSGLSAASDATMPMSRLPSRETPSAGRRSRRQDTRSGPPSDGLGGGGAARSASAGGRRSGSSSGGDLGRGSVSGSHPAVEPRASASRGSVPGNGDVGSRRGPSSSRPSRESRRSRRPDMPPPETRPSGLPSAEGPPPGTRVFNATSLPTTSGLFPAVPSSPGSGLAPDLPWGRGGEPTGTPPDSPFGGDVGGSALADPGKVAPHVAAMSDEARAAVQHTVGNAGGLAGPPGAGAAEDLARRGQLINFLSSVRP